MIELSKLCVIWDRKYEQYKDNKGCLSREDARYWADFFERTYGDDKTRKRRYVVQQVEVEVVTRPCVECNSRGYYQISVSSTTNRTGRYGCQVCYGDRERHLVRMKKKHSVIFGSIEYFTRRYYRKERERRLGL